MNSFSKCDFIYFLVVEEGVRKVESLTTLVPRIYPSTVVSIERWPKIGEIAGNFGNIRKSSDMPFITRDQVK